MDKNELDMVNNPAHYEAGSIATIEHIKDLVNGLNGFESYCIGTCAKYLYRHQYKGNPLQDLKKAQWYLNTVIKSMESVNG